MLFHSHIYHISWSLLLKQRSLESRAVGILGMRVRMEERRVLSSLFLAMIGNLSLFHNDREPKDHKFWATSMKSESYIMNVYSNGGGLMRPRCSQRIVIMVMEEVHQERGRTLSLLGMQWG